MNNSLVSKWFGDSFAELHPLLQKLHNEGGSLSGAVDIKVGAGIAGFIGKRLAKKFGVPIEAGEHKLRVDISHQEDGMHWDRCFDESKIMKSLFVPVGNKDNGYWLEKTGSIHLYLSVDIKESAWYWHSLKTKIKGIRIPAFLLPKTTAYKRIENGSYRFYVGFSLPFVGTVLSYSGLLNANI